MQNSAKSIPIDTRKELSKNAGVSHDTIHKVEKIKKAATQELQDTLRTEQSGVSINLASKVAQEEPKLQLTLTLCENGRNLVATLTVVKFVSSLSIKGFSRCKRSPGLLS